jgi:hypothetical protein
VGGVGGLPLLLVIGPTAPARGALRVLRGGLLAVTSASLAVAAHAVAGGGLPDTGLTLLLTAGVGAAGVALADRRRGPLAILLALAASHLGMHLVLALAMPGEPLVPGGSMLLAHLAGVAVAGLLLTRAEAAIFAVLAAVARLLPRPPHRPLPPVDPAPLRPAAPPADRALAVLLTRARPRRGPPLRA